MTTLTQGQCHAVLHQDRGARVLVRDDADGDCFLDEAAAFPAGKYDDVVDNLSLMGRIIDTISAPARKNRPTHAEDFNPYG